MKQRREGFSLVELLIVISIILIIAAIAGPHLGRARRTAQETAAISTIKTLHVAQTQYYSQYMKYAKALGELGPPESGAASAQAADLIPAALANGAKGGYLYTLQPTPIGYQINASPEVYGTSGERTFFSDQTQVIRENHGPEPATVQDKALP
jgi:type IV pilus assembly protein PilA